jgi:hypothetical protein
MALVTLQWAGHASRHVTTLAPQPLQGIDLLGSARSSDALPHHNAR